MPRLKYPLAVPVKAGLKTINLFELRAETSLRDNVNDFREYADVLYSAHAPTTIGEERLNIAATDRDFRNECISVFKDYIDRCAMFPNIGQINMHFGLKNWVSETQPRGQKGDYETHIESIRTLSDYARTSGIEIVLENLNCYWALNNISDDTDFAQVNWNNSNEAFGMNPEEWIQMCLDVDRDNVQLCLDTSHVSTYGHRFPEEEREGKIEAFLNRPDLITHVHWSDNYLYDVRGRNDSHLSVGKGSIPTDFHRRVKALEATILLEHFYTKEELHEELEYIERL